MRRAAALLAASLATMGAGARNDLAPQPGQAPFGDKIAQQRLPTYNRATSVIATSGPIDEAGAIEAKRVGFASVVDLRPAGADTAAEHRWADFSHLRYFNLPVEGRVPKDADVQRFAAIAADHDNLPLLLHGTDADQSGAMWALYRASLGVPPAIALQDGTTAGLSASAPALRARLAEARPK